LLDFFHASSTPNIGGFHGTIYHADPEYRRRLHFRIKQEIQANLDRWLIDYRVCNCNFMTKEPGDATSEMPLHQDWSFVHEPELASVHIWCPLVDVDHQNGCLAVVPGSHHLSDTVRAFADDCPFREQYPLIRERFVVELPMKAGEAVFFDGRLIHSSPPNVSSNRRVTAQAIGIPNESAIYHWWRISPDKVQAYEIDEEFFFHYILHQPPKNAKLVGTVDYAPKQLSAEVVATLQEYMPSPDRTP
jgi:hypothetical protein